MFATYREAVDWITGRITFGIKPGMKRMELLMEKLDHPERRLKFIHVAGTNGKGSTCAYLASVLRRCGYDVGMFTSPYLISYADRIQYNQQPIPEEALLKLINEIKPIVDEIAAGEYGPPSMFEVSTTLAIVYFARVAYPDYVVWETGLGGRLDSTNIVTPVVSVITNIGHDHMDVLGDTLTKVAAEKAGIIKAGVPVITAIDQPECLEVVREAAAAKKATLYELGRQYRFTPGESKLDDLSLDFEGPFRRIPDVRISLNGAHQRKNAAVALMTIEVLRQYYALIVEDEDLYAGMKEARWPGRLELVSERPRILLDGAHNPEGAETLAQALKEMYTYEKLHFMMGMLASKNHSGYLRHILPLVDTIIMTEPDFHKKGDASELAKLARELQHDMGREANIIVEPDWKRALDLLRQMTGQNDLAVVSGTLYLISDVRSWLLYQTASEKGW